MVDRWMVDRWMVVLYPHAGIVATYPRTKRAAHAVDRGCALAVVSANRLPEISQFPRNARRRGRRRHGKSSNAIGNRKSKIVNSQPPTIRRHLHLSTSTRLRPFPTTARAPSPRTGGRNKCDPPVSILGRSGLRPSRATHDGEGVVATALSTTQLPTTN